MKNIAAVAAFDRRWLLRCTTTFELILCLIRWLQNMLWINLKSNWWLLLVWWLQDLLLRLSIMLCLLLSLWKLWLSHTLRDAICWRLFSKIILPRRLRRFTGYCLMRHWRDWDDIPSKVRDYEFCNIFVERIIWKVTENTIIWFQTQELILLASIE